MEKSFASNKGKFMASVLNCSIYYFVILCLIHVVYFADNPVASGTERGSSGVKQSRTPVKA